MTPELDRENSATADFRSAAALRLHDEPPDCSPAKSRSAPIARSDFDLNPQLETILKPKANAEPAAVLVPIVVGEDLSVLLTQRTDDLPTHAGQISFPGGKIDEGDDGFIAAALREAEEEIGLARAFVEPLGYLDCYRTATGFSIVPVVGLVKPGFTLHINEREVATVFEVPLEFLMNEENHQLHTRFWRGADRTFHAMPYGQHYIWGATAGILKNMHERLYA